MSADTSAVQGGEDTIRRFSCFPSLRVIEIECNEFEAQRGSDLVQPAKETLRACSKYKPAPKGKSARAVQDAEQAQERLAALYHDPMMVKVRYFPGNRTWRRYGLQNPSDFYPTKVEEHLV